MRVSESLLDEARLDAVVGAWLDRHLGGPSASCVLTKVAGGNSNILFRIERGGRSLALRMPPRTANDVTSNNIEREARVLAALAQSAAPHARLVAQELSGDVAGRPFLILEWIDGFVARDPLPAPFLDQPGLRHDLGLAVVDALADIANVDWRGLGLEGFGKPDNFLERQVQRWLGQLGRYKVREIPHLDRVGEWISAHIPTTQRAALLHGDYSFANVMIGPQAPARVAAVVDWESATIGDPLLDLGHLLSGWADAGSGPTWATFVDWTSGYPSRAECADRYAQRTGLSLDHLDFYMVLALFKLGIIMEGAYARFLSGKSDLPAHARMETMVPEMIAQAARTAKLI